jgi:hypothetical protein
MKKKMAVLLCVVLGFVSLSACGTNDRNDLLFLNDLIYCNITECGGSFGFNLIYLYQGRKPTVEFVRFDNYTADALLEEMFDDTMDTLVDKKYNGYKMVILGFSFDTSILSEGTAFQINSITLSVNGTEQTLDTTGRIILNKVDSDNEKYNCNSIYETNVPVVVFSQCKGIEASFFNYHTDQDIVLEKFEFSDFLNIQDSCVYVDGTPLGSLDRVFPLSVAADKTISIEIDADFGKYDPFADYYVNFLLYYTSEEDGSKILKDYIAVQALSNYNDFSNLIDHVIPS